MSHRKHKLFTPANIALIGVMTALSTILYMFLPEIPLVPGVGYLKIDFSDIPAIMLGVLVNPVAGVWVEVFKNLIHLTKTTTFGVGELMNIGVAAALIFGMWGGLKLFARLSHRHALHPLPYFSAATVTVGLTILAGWLLNAALTPVFYRVMGWPLTAELLWAGVWGSTALNAVKAALNLFPFYPVMYAAHKALERSGKLFS